MGEFNRDHSATIAKLIRERDEMFAKYDALMLKYRRAEDNAVVLMRKLEARIRERDEALVENERLQKCCTQRGARMQIMREWMDSQRGIGPPTEWWYFLEERPEARDWFDDDGVPVEGK